MTEVLLVTPVVEFHKIIVKAGYRCSKHKHEHKWNEFYVGKGRLDIVVFKKDYGLTDTTTLAAGDFTTVRPGEYHYFLAAEDTLAFEVYYPELLSEDIIRENVGAAVEGAE